jgi:DNA polymerase-3 subunit chi
MPKIDFYILTDDAKFSFACRLIEKAYKSRHRIYIHTENEKDAHRLDEMLWTYKDDSFLPHNLYGEGPESAPPIQIGFNVTPDNHRDILLNLSSSVPEFFSQFQRILELVANDSDSQNLGRERFKHYRAQNFEITTHKLQNELQNG